MAQGGAMRLVADQPEEVLRQIALRSLPEVENTVANDTLNALAWMAANRQLEVKLAIREAEDGLIGRGIFHEKAGIFLEAEQLFFCKSESG